jgi:hypothetical protein
MYITTNIQEICGTNMLKRSVDLVIRMSRFVLPQKTTTICFIRIVQFANMHVSTRQCMQLGIHV